MNTSITQSATNQDIYDLIINLDSKLGKQIEDVQDEVKSLKQVVNGDIKVLKDKIKALEEENKLVKGKLKYIERKIKQNNIFIYGLEEETEERQDTLLQEVLHVINHTLEVKLTPYEINNIYRIGKNKGKRPIILSFVTNLKKSEVLRNTRKLKGTNIAVSEDLIEEDRTERKLLVDTLKQVKRRNKKAIIRGNGIIIESIYYSVKDILDQKHLEENNQEFSPPPIRRTVSDPSTPSPTVFDSDSEEEGVAEEKPKNTSPQKLIVDIHAKETDVEKKPSQQQPRSINNNPKNLTGKIDKKKDLIRKKSERQATRFASGSHKIV